MGSFCDLRGSGFLRKETGKLEGGAGTVAYGEAFSFGRAGGGFC